MPDGRGMNGVSGENTMNKTTAVSPQEQTILKSKRPVLSERPVAVEVRDGKLWVMLEDGREIAAPIERYPRLAQATPEQRAKVRLTTEGMHWEEIDEDVSVAGMLCGCDGYADSLEAVMTVQEIAEEFGISRFTVHDAIRNDWLPARRSGKTYLIRRRDALERWGEKKKL
jgi:excisionase family DNA binding protein